MDSSLESNIGAATEKACLKVLIAEDMETVRKICLNELKEKRLQNIIKLDFTVKSGSPVPLTGH